MSVKCRLKILFLKSGLIYKFALVAATGADRTNFRFTWGVLHCEVFTWFKENLLLLQLRYFRWVKISFSRVDHHMKPTSGWTKGLGTYPGNKSKIFQCFHVEISLFRHASRIDILQTVTFSEIFVISRMLKIYFSKPVEKTTLHFWRIHVYSDIRILLNNFWDWKSKLLPQSYKASYYLVQFRCTRLYLAFQTM